MPVGWRIWNSSCTWMLLTREQIFRLHLENQKCYWPVPQGNVIYSLRAVPRIIRSFQVKNPQKVRVHFSMGIWAWDFQDKKEDANWHYSIIEITMQGRSCQGLRHLNLLLMIFKST